MVYLYNGDAYLIKQAIDKLINDKQIDKLNISYYDGTSSIKAIVDDANMMSLLGDQKLIIVNDASYLGGSALPSDIDLLIAYLEHANPTTLLLFTLYGKVDDRKKINKLIAKTGLVKEFKVAFKLDNMIQDAFRPYQLNDKALKLFIDRTNHDLALIDKEIVKLKNYKGTDFKISTDDILNLTTNNVDTDLFKLIDNIVKGNKDAAISSYEEMLANNMEPLMIVILLANQFRIIYQAKGLYLKGYNEQLIASELQIHPYRIKLALEAGRSFKETTLIHYIHELANLDIAIKNNEVEPQLSLELFILTI